MEYIIIPFVAFVGSILTFFSGFGLGTILLPAFALFFPVEISIAMSALVHFVNNLAKFKLLYKHTNFDIALIFGASGLIASFAGAKLLSLLSNSNFQQHQILLFNTNTNINLLNLIIGILMIFFALFELIPKLQNLKFAKKLMPLGGVISGFFGGLSGHQGALRSAFLIKANLDKYQFIATGVLISLFIDSIRIITYTTTFSFNPSTANNNSTILIFLSISAAIIGALVGKKFLPKIQINFLQIIIGIGLIGYGVGLIFGKL